MARQDRPPLYELTLARIREFVREPSAMFWTFGFPVLLAIGLGVAFRHRPPEAYHVALVGPAPATESVVAALAGREDIKAEAESSAKAAEELRRGKIQLVVEVQPGTTHPTLTYRFDPMSSESKAARQAFDNAIQRALGRRDVVETTEQTVSEPGARYIDFLIPGLVGLNLMGSSMWGIGYAIALARRRRLLRRLAATPMRRSHYLLSYMFSRIAFLGAEVAVLLTVGWLLFDVSVQGSFVALGLVALFGTMSFMGVALLVASRTDNTEVAAGLMNAVMLPMWVLSGSFFSYERFPEVVHPLIRLLPLTAFNDALRAVMNDGVTLAQTWHQLLVLGLIGSICFTFALRLFRWQ